jgi:predicted small secreted protein
MRPNQVSGGNTMKKVRVFVWIIVILAVSTLLMAPRTKYGAGKVGDPTPVETTQ